MIGKLAFVTAAVFLGLSPSGVQAQLQAGTGVQCVTNSFTDGPTYLTLRAIFTSAGVAHVSGINADRSSWGPLRASYSNGKLSYTTTMPNGSPRTTYTLTVGDRNISGYANVHFAPQNSRNVEFTCSDSTNRVMTTAAEGQLADR